MKTVSLGALCEVIGGGTPSKGNDDFYKGDIPWATVRDMRSEVISDTEFKITPEAVKKSATNIIPKGNVVIATRVGLGKVCFLSKDVAINQDLRGIIPKNQNELDVRFLFWWFQSISHLIVKAGTGATVQGVKLPFVKSLQIPAFTFSQQKRIAAILDEAFAGIDQAIANTEKNLASACELFESYLNTIFTQKGEGWRNGIFSDIGGIIKTGPFGSLLHKADYVENGTPLINPAHIISGKILPDTRKTVNDYALDRLSSYRVSSGDVIIGRRGEMGRCAAVTDKENGWLCGTGCFIIKPKNNNKAEFLSLMLSSPYYREEITKLASGATMLNLSNKALGSLRIAIPSPEDQSNILDQIYKVTTDETNLKLLYSQKLTALNELKQSLLQKAFSGELTADTDIMAEAAE